MRRIPMIRKFSIAIMLMCFLGTSAFAQVNPKKPLRGRQGTYKLADKKGYHGPIDIPRCDASAEKILERWRGSLVIEYSKGTVLVNGESWIFVFDHPFFSVSAQRPSDPSIKGRIDVAFHLKDRDGPNGRYKQGVAFLIYSGDNPTCQTGVLFAGDWTPP